MPEVQSFRNPVSPTGFHTNPLVHNRRVLTSPLLRDSVAVRYEKFRDAPPSPATRIVPAKTDGKRRIMARTPLVQRLQDTFATACEGQTREALGNSSLLTRRELLRRAGALGLAAATVSAFPFYPPTLDVFAICGH